MIIGVTDRQGIQTVLQLADRDCSGQLEVLLFEEGVDAMHCLETGQERHLAVVLDGAEQ